MCSILVLFTFHELRKEQDSVDDIDQKVMKVWDHIAIEIERGDAWFKFLKSENLLTYSSYKLPAAISISPFVHPMNMSMFKT